MLRKKHARKHETESEQPKESDAETELKDEASVEGAEALEQDTGAAAGTRRDRDEAERLAAEAADWKDRCLRAIADMDNVRRRARLEADEARRFANLGLIADLLPVLDNFARAVESAEQTEDFEALRSGVELIHRQLSELLERTGLERIEAVGQPFDPNFHEAILQVEPQEGQAPHQVVEELRAGYRMKDRVVRPTLVKVTSG